MKKKLVPMSLIALFCLASGCEKAQEIRNMAAQAEQLTDLAAQAEQLKGKWMPKTGQLGQTLAGLKGRLAALPAGLPGLDTLKTKFAKHEGDLKSLTSKLTAALTPAGAVAAAAQIVEGGGANLSNAFQSLASSIEESAKQLGQLEVAAKAQGNTGAVLHDGLGAGE